MFLVKFVASTYEYISWQVSYQALSSVGPACVVLLACVYVCCYCLYLLGGCSSFDRARSIMWSTDLSYVVSQRFILTVLTGGPYFSVDWTSVNVYHPWI